METPTISPSKCHFVLFKSYYVVWKQPGKTWVYRNLNSLNRTMQYGNFFKKMKITIREHCLNRTMQYGNEII